jgi:hypothetical protein
MQAMPSSKVTYYPLGGIDPSVNKLVRRGLVVFVVGSFLVVTLHLFGCF